eukprot:7407169-Lingulodinium_polyedra.AAC.1
MMRATCSPPGSFCLAWPTLPSPSPPASGLLRISPGAAYRTSAAVHLAWSCLSPRALAVSCACHLSS